jgi:hypothetical protein
MWPFSRKSQSEKVLAVFDDAADFACEKWLYYNSVLKFKDDVDFRDILAGFIFPLQEGLQNKFPLLKESPEPLFFLIAAKGIVKSKTHTKEQLEDALSISLPI